MPSRSAVFCLTASLFAPLAGCLAPADLPAPDGGSLADTDGGVRALVLHDSPLVRLDRTEYDNTVRDLLGDTTHPSAGFPRDPVVFVFDNNAGAMGVDDLLLEAYERAADRLVDTALTGDTPARQRIVTCSALDDATCVRAILGKFARKAFRRPVTSEELDELMALVEDARQQGDDGETGLRQALKATLVSPSFLYRIEPDEPNAAPRALRDHELAARLSYFLWSSMPDDELDALADQGQLTDGTTYAAQVQRMLADPKAAALEDDFAAQWLGLRKLGDATRSAIDAEVFPSFDEGLRASMIGETSRYFDELLRGDHDIRELIDADFTFIDARLAQHYGMPAPSGDGFARVQLDGTQRFGLLTQAAVLTSTSPGNRTSPTRRGKFVLGRLLCSPPAPAPANVPALPEQGFDPDATLRERLEAHLSKGPACAGCHAAMDPIGFSMEHYDGIGRWRDKDGEAAIDATGTFTSGAAFDGLQQMSAALKADARFSRCVAQQLFSYAMRREPLADDQPALDALTASAASQGNRLKAFIAAIVTSKSFTWRGGVQ